MEFMTGNGIKINVLNINKTLPVLKCEDGFFFNILMKDGRVLNSQLSPSEGEAANNRKFLTKMTDPINHIEERKKATGIGKLDYDQVIDIFNALKGIRSIKSFWVKSEELADNYKVSITTIRNIALRKSWVNVTSEL